MTVKALFCVHLFGLLWYLAGHLTPISFYFLITKWMNLTSAGLWRAGMKNGERVPGCRLQEGASCSDQKKQAYDRDLLFPLKMKRDDKILAYEKMRIDIVPSDSVSDYQITVNHSALRATRCIDALSYHLVVLLSKIYHVRQIQYVPKKTIRTNFFKKPVLDLRVSHKVHQWPWQSSGDGVKT